MNNNAKKDPYDRLIDEMIEQEITDREEALRERLVMKLLEVTLDDNDWYTEDIIESAKQLENYILNKE